MHCMMEVMYSDLEYVRSRTGTGELPVKRFKFEDFLLDQDRFR